SDTAGGALADPFEPASWQSVGLFIFQGEGKGEEPPTRGLVGAWCASGDNAGRLYPMIVFGSYDYHQLVATGAALPIALWPLLTSAYELATTGRMLAVYPLPERLSPIVPPLLPRPPGASARHRAWPAPPPRTA